MNESSSMLLIGVGGSGAAVARGVDRAFGGGLRHLITDTDAATGQADGDDFILIGGDRLAGHGSGGDLVAARLAAEESVTTVDGHLEGVRLAVVTTSLGGGTGGGATVEILKHLSDRGIPSILFATLPFSFEGEKRQRNARGIQSMLAEAANASFFIPLDKLVGANDNMDAAMRLAIDTLASGITLFWRLVLKPGYIRMDVERIRGILGNAGRGRFATVTVQGPERAGEAVDRLARSELLLTGNGNPRAIFCGVLAGEDLRLSEIGTVADGLTRVFGKDSQAFELGTVNDEITFTGRLSVVVMLFENDGKDSPGADPDPKGTRAPARRKTRGVLAVGPTGRGRFTNAEPTFWNGEDLDVPTYLRREINLGF